MPWHNPSRSHAPRRLKPSRPTTAHSPNGKAVSKLASLAVCPSRPRGPSENTVHVAESRRTASNGLPTREAVVRVRRLGLIWDPRCLHDKQKSSIYGGFRNG